MSTRTTKNKDRTGKSPGRKNYDKELVRDRTFDLLTLLLGTGKDQGARLVWDCPECGKAEKYSVKKAEGKGGCLVEGCRLSGYDDVFGMLAKLEGLDYHADFPAVLVRSYDLLGLEPTAERRAPPKGGRTKTSARGSSAPKKNPNGKSSDDGSRNPSLARAVPVSPRDSASENDRATGRSDEAPRKNLDELLALASRVYARILELCPLETRDRKYLKQRGISRETIKKGRFGTMTVSRARNVKATLQREFGRERLLTVPGFSEDEEDGRLKWTLTGDYVLIPYHGAEGRVTTIEGRVVGEHKGPRKYVTLRRAGNHLYLFPGHRPEDLQAVTEGAMGAIVAAECGLTVGAIQGCERFRASPSPEMLDGAPGDPLLELIGTDFGGRTIPYIPDADDPPNLNVLRAAPKAARWIAESQNGEAAICLLPRGVDLDEWLLSLKPEERGARFAELLARATPPEDDAGPATPFAVPESVATRRNSQFDQDEPDQATASPPPSEEVESNGDATKNDREDIAAEDLARRGANAPPSRISAFRKRKAKSEAEPGTQERSSPESQSMLWDDADASEGGSEAETARENHNKKGSVSRGARKLRDEVYRAMLEALSLKEEHLEALQRRSVMRATARVGKFTSVDPESAERVVSDLVDRFGAKKLLSVPGFEADGMDKMRLSFAPGGTGEYVLIPCFDAEGFLAGVEGLVFDPESAEIEVEETVPLTGAGSHLYVFAHYAPGQIEGFCEGPLGAMLAAQEDVVIGATGGFRRYRAASGPGSARGRRPVDAALPELEGVDFGGRRLAYAPRSGGEPGEANARYHEAASAARWLVERQGGRPMVVGLGEGEDPADAPDDGVEEGAARSSGGPTSLGEWILALPEDEERDKLRELFPESPEREDALDEGEDHRGEGGEAGGDAEPPPLSSKIAYGALTLAAVVGVVLDSLIGRLRDFVGYVSVGPGGELLMYAGTLGSLRRVADSAPFHILYDLHWLASLAGALVVMFAVIAKARELERARWRAARVRLGGRWELHLAPGKALPSGAVLTRGEALWAALAWPVAYVFSGWLISGTEALLSLAARLRMAPPLEDPLVADPTLASVYTATVFSAFVLWRRRSMRAASSRMLAGRIRH